MKIEEWNAIEKDPNTDSLAIDGDLVTEIDGVAFLIQRKDEGNNVICKRIRPGTKTILQTFEEFRAFCQSNGVQYIRIEGAGKHKYTLLELMRKYAPKEANYVLHKQQTEETGNKVYYVKTY